MNSVLKMVLKWKRHFFKVNCNNCTVHLVLGFCFFQGGQGCSEISFQIDSSKPNVKGQNKLGGTEWEARYPWSGGGGCVVEGSCIVQKTDCEEVVSFETWLT